MLLFCSKTLFSDRLLQSTNSLFGLVLCHSKFKQKLRNICTVPQILFRLKKNGGTLDTCCNRMWYENSQRGNIFPSLLMPTLHIIQFLLRKRMWSMIVKTSPSFFFFLTTFFFFLTTFFFFLTTCCLRSGHLMQLWFILVTRVTSVAKMKQVSAMFCRLPPNHGNSKLQSTLLALGPPKQILSTCLI